MAISIIYIYIHHHPVFQGPDALPRLHPTIAPSRKVWWCPGRFRRWDPHGHPPATWRSCCRDYWKKCHSKLRHKLKNNAWKEYFFPFGKASFRRFGRVDDLTVLYLSEDIVCISQTDSWILLRIGFSYQNLADTLNTPSSWTSSIHITQDTKLFGIISPLRNWLINMTI